MTTSGLHHAPTRAPSRPPDPPRRTRWARWPRTGRYAALGGTLGGVVGGIVLAGIGWTLVVATGRFPRELFPSIPEILRAGHTLWSDGLLLADLGASLRRAVIGFVTGSILGVGAAIITASTRAGRALLQPVLRLLSPIPTIGIVPLAILWFGIGENSKTLVIALGVFVPVWINSHAGFASTPADFLRAARCLGAGRWQTLARVVVPEAAPDVVSGLRVGAAMAFVLIVVAEMTGTTSGLGYRIYQAQLFSQADRLIFCLILLGVLGAACDTAIAAITAPLTRWAHEER